MKLLAVDSNSILNRAFFGIRLLSNSEGVYTNAILGFTNILLKVIDEEKPDAFAFAFDRPEPTFRHKMYDDYKSGRKEMPEELAMQFPIMKDIIRDMGYKIIELPGFEADDILGTLAKASSDDDNECVVLTGDRDCLQLVSDSVTVRLASNKQDIIYTRDEVLKQYGVEPKAMIEVKGLMGDTSDKIPGVKGIGEKTALKLISEYGSIEYIYDHIDEIDVTAGVRKKLIDGKDDAFLSRTLGLIDCDVKDVDTNYNSYLQTEGDKSNLASTLTSLSMTKLMDKLGITADESQITFFGNSPKEETHKLNILKTLDEVKKVIVKDEILYIAFVNDDTKGPEMMFSIGGEYYRVDSDEFLEIAKFLFEGKNEIVAMNSKDMFRYAFSNDIDMRDVKFDVEVAGYILNPLESNYKPSYLSVYYNIKSDVLILEDSEDYQISVADLTSLVSVYEPLAKRIDETDAHMLMYEIEMPLSKVLASMEVVGFEIDEKGVIDFGEMLAGKIESLEKSIHSYSKEEFNINSPKQLSVVLFEELELPAKKKTKTGYSTNADVLEDLRGHHPIIDDILEYRQLAKLKSTYVDGLLKVIREDGRVHTKFMQTETRTGRISSTEPNMQNIPVRTELGREMRRFFTAKEGSLLADADYSQIELRILSHIADDETMQKAFKDGVDIHTLTASQVFGVPIEMVTPKMRSDSKAVNFGIVYGISAFSLSKDINVSVQEAQAYIDGYLKTYSGVAQYMKDTVERGKEKGYVETLFGRRRPLPELKSKNYNERSFGERVAMNMPIQGTAADVIKIAMVKVYNRLEKENMKSKLILQIHDELIIEAPDDEAERAGQILKEEMESAVDFKVKLVADVNIAKTWYDSH